jgi:sugar O-acyltransferase (sialic acid O-acetyltransferase NeuD family)
MSTDGLLLIGAGGHARVVYDAWRLHNPKRTAIIFDESPLLAGTTFFDLRVQIAWPKMPDNVGSFHVAIGHNLIRLRFSAEAEAMGVVIETIVHPGALVSPYAVIAGGCFVAAGAIVAPMARLGSGCIVNHAASVDHDCVIGDFCHIAPGARLCGGVHVGDEVFIGAGAVVLPGRRIGTGAKVGAGAVVLQDVAAGSIVKGVPAA